MGRPEWVRDAVFYQIFPDRLAKAGPSAEVVSFQAWDEVPNYFAFKGGNLWGVAEDLDRIADLGFNALYFTPIFSSPANHRYHTHDYFQVDPILGGEDAFDHLMIEAKKRGFRVVLDGVFNHTGRSFFAFGHILENGIQSPYIDWYEVNKDFLRTHGTLNAFPMGVGGSSVNGWETYGYNAWWNMPALPKLNVANPEVREFLLKVAEHWVKKGIDGWRLDVPNEIKVPGFWEEFRERVKAINPACYIVGEIWDEDVSYLRGDRFDGLMNYPLGKAILGFFLRKQDKSLVARTSLKEFPQAFDAASLLSLVKHNLAFAGSEVPYSQLNLFTSHDTPRIQNIASFEIQDTLQAYAFMMCLPGAPCVYYGDEYGLHGDHDPHCRGTISSEVRANPPPFYDAIREIIHLRRELEPLRSGQVSFQMIDGWPGRSFILDRKTLGQSVRVFVNGSSTPLEIRRPNLESDVASPQVLLVSGITAKRLGSTGLHQGGKGLSLPSHSLAIVF